MRTHSRLSNMAKGRRNSQKKRKSNKATDEGENEVGDEGVKKCPHISKAVKLQNLQNKIPHTTLGQCLKCGELDSSEGLGVCLCLCCAHQGCDRNSEEKHSLSHNESNPSHNIVVHLQTWVVWCYGCDDEVPVEPESTLHNSIKLILKAMNLSPPPELEASLSSPTNIKASTDKPKKDDSKVNSQLRSQIKGLANLGNTCFFNAVMQNLCQTELLHVAASCTAQEGFTQHVTPMNKDMPILTVAIQEVPGLVTRALWKLLQDSRSSNERTLNPRQLFGEICKTATRFRGFRQQDSQELLRYLLDSIRNEELRRVKVAVLKSYGVTGGANTKNLDDNKRAQIKEYGASAEAPLIDSVFAGRLVSIVTCHRCHQEFKVEETFLDLSLPLASPPQESFNNKFFAKGGKQSAKSQPKTPNKASTNIGDSDEETEKNSKGKTPSKHQLKSARKAERKKGKKGKGHGKKGKSPQEAIGNKEEDDEEVKENSGEEGDELDQMNVSDLDGSDNEKYHELSERVEALDLDKETEEPANSSGGPDMISNTEVQLGDASNSHTSLASGIECDTNILDSNKVEYLEGNAVDTARAGQSDTVEDALKCSGEIRSMRNERATNQLNTESTDCLQGGRNITHERNSQEYGQNLHSVDKEISSMDSKCEQEIHADEMTEQELRTEHCVEGSNQDSSTESIECRMGNNDQDFQSESDAKLEKNEAQSVNEIVNEIVNLSLNTSVENADESHQCAVDVSGSALVNSRGTIILASEGSPSEDHAEQEQGKGCLENGKETLVETEGLAQNKPGNLETGSETLAPTEGLAQDNSTSVSVAGNESNSLTNNNATVSVENDQNCTSIKQETNVDNEMPCSDSTVSNEKETKMEQGVKCGSEALDEHENDSEGGTDCRSLRPLTLQPAYRPSPGECSVMSCLSQFCASEMLDGNNKFACEECSKRVQQVQNGKAFRSAQDDEKDDDGGDSSSEDESKGATARKQTKNKKKDAKNQTVYTIASKQLLISLAPPVLTLHLKRFQQARFTLRKLTKHVDFPLELNLAPFCSRSGRTRADSEGQVLYSLYGIIQHSGNMNSGHYTASVKVREPPARGLFDKITSMSELTEFITNMWTAGKTDVKHRMSRCRHEPAPGGQWFHVSDSSVVAVAEAKVLKSQAYMLFYGRLPLDSR